MTNKEKKDILSSLNANLTDEELLNIVNGVFEKAIQTTIQPLSLIPNSDWDKWDEFVLKNRLTEKFQQVLINTINHGTSSLIVFQNEENDGNKVDVIVPVATGQMFANRGGTALVKTAHVIAEQQNLLYGSSAATKMVSFIKKNGVILHAQGVITAAKGGGYDYPEAIANSDGFAIYKDAKTIPIVWFTSSWLTIAQKQMLAANKKMAVKILKEVVSQLELAGPNVLFIGSANNTTTQATGSQKAVLTPGKRAHVIKESLNRSVTNPIISFNNQPWFKEFWELIESMVNSLIEGLQVGDMNQGGKGTANMHTTEVATSFGVKAQKIINTQNMFLSSWDLFAKVIREAGISIPAKTKFTYDSPDNLLVNQIKQTQETEQPVVEKDPTEEE